MNRMSKYYWRDAFLHTVCHGRVLYENIREMMLEYDRPGSVCDGGQSPRQYKSQVDTRLSLFQSFY